MAQTIENRRAGRPRTKPEPSVHLTCDVPASMFARLLAEAAASGRARSAIIRDALEFAFIVADAQRRGPRCAPRDPGDGAKAAA
jgi:hypothetical protein